jgi:single-stranded-DNA-specific exonuclease
MQLADGHCHGSGRSIDGFNLHAALAECSSLLERFGGHDMAAGLGLSASNLSAFADAFIEVANAKLHADDLVPSLRYDCPADVSELTPLAVEQLARLGPFGRGNPTPRVVVRDVRVARNPERFGARGAHASVHVRAGQREMRLVGWRWGERIHAVPGGAAIDAIVEPRLNVWNGRVRVEPVLLDLAVRND